MAHSITGSNHFSSSAGRGTAAKAAKIPAVISRESPGKKKPKKRPVSTNTMLQISAGPPDWTSPLSPSGSKSEWRKWRIDSGTRPDSSSRQPRGPPRAREQRSVHGPLRKCLFPYGSRKRQDRRPRQSSELAKCKRGNQQANQRSSQRPGQPQLRERGISGNHGGMFGGAKQ